MPNEIHFNKYKKAADTLGCVIQKIIELGSLIGPLLGELVESMLMLQCVLSRTSWVLSWVISSVKLLQRLELLWERFNQY